MSDNIQISLPKVRLLFPNLFEKVRIDGKYIKTERERYFGAVFLLHKKEHAETIANINKASEKLIQILKIKKLPHPIMTCCDEELEGIYDGDEAGRARKDKLAYLAGHYKLQTKTFVNPVLRKVKGVDLIVDKDLNPFYPGCYVNAIIELRTYNNEFGKGISKYLRYVLFAKDGEKIGGAAVDIDGDSYFKDNESEEELEFDDKDLF
jgi:hypothetical protein